MPTNSIRAVYEECIIRLSREQGIRKEGGEKGMEENRKAELKTIKEKEHTDAHHLKEEGYCWGGTPLCDRGQARDGKRNKRENLRVTVIKKEKKSI